uniref:Heme ABC transporter permease n=1 Tax=Palpitomonas bilix TaxID=652834 RepID=A0A1E1GHS4_9EUKA|nr:heme ABC transporter permease [Palpitomonas bilix]YP_009317255.1 heme ABC transporter permease [Palpitomonas bilix]BAV82398.1 heme ABC transporter permease [Palpitomonas bilix]BAV82423.1 heme ABC transporter permease [Palpitomonas bilix]
MKKFFYIFRQDLFLTSILNSTLLISTFFFFLIVFIFSICIGPDLIILWRFGFSILWVGLLFTSMLSLENMFKSDKQNGSLELFFLSPLRFELVVLSKTLSHWFICGLPLTILWPFLSLFLGNPYFKVFSLKFLVNPLVIQITLIFLFGSLILSFLGTIGSVLTVGLKQRGILLLLILIPLYIPVLIFGISSMNSILLEFTFIEYSSIFELAVKPEYIFLQGFFLLIFIISPWLSSYILHYFVN